MRIFIEAYQFTLILENIYHKLDLGNHDIN